MWRTDPEHRRSQTLSHSTPRFEASPVANKGLEQQLHFVANKAAELEFASGNLLTGLAFAFVRSMQEYDLLGSSVSLRRTPENVSHY